MNAVCSRADYRLKHPQRSVRVIEQPVECPKLARPAIRAELSEVGVASRFSNLPS
jgi:hypothetical protein